jgi:hypothetical protein
MSLFEDMPDLFNCLHIIDGIEHVLEDFYILNLLALLLFQTPEALLVIFLLHHLDLAATHLALAATYLALAATYLALAATYLVVLRYKAPLAVLLFQTPETSNNANGIEES